ncbi:hypothetical protein [Alteromonas sp. CYL-A6]|uniref:hypothetical protein n=1 Tax=Alteromonas nitratireducens TaxID=3390813 RepID=UPI0034B4689E
MKNLFIALLIGIILINGLGALADNIFDMHIVMADDLLNPLESVLVMSGVAVVLVIVGFIIAISLAGALFIGLFAGMIALLAVGISAFWPLLLVIGCIALVQHRRSATAH